MEAQLGRARGRARGRGEGGEIPAAGPNENIPAPRGGLAPRGGAGAAANLQQRMERMREARERRVAGIEIPLTRPSNVSVTQGIVIIVR